MSNAAKALILLAALLVGHPAYPADPAGRAEPNPSGPARAEPDTAPSALDGAKLFATHCAMCHKPAELAQRFQRAADPMPVKADMAAFLARHGRSDATADEAIIDYLASGSFR